MPSVSRPSAIVVGRTSSDVTGRTYKLLERAGLQPVSVEHPPTHSALGSESELATHLRAAGARHQAVLVVTDPIDLAPGALDLAIQALEDPRVGAVSFLSNAAGPMSYPFKGTAVPWTSSGKRAVDLTMLLRNISPSATPVTVGIIQGPAVLLSPSLLALVCFPDHAPTLATALADMGMQAIRRGLRLLADTATFVHRIDDLMTTGDEAEAEIDTAWLGGRHRFAQGLFDEALTNAESPFGRAHHMARVKLDGLRVLMDGSCLGPLEMGTQVGVVALTRALAERDDVAEVTITLPGVRPGYATALVHPKITSVRTNGVEGRFDVAYRAFQPGVGYALEPVRAVADRVVVGILDLISYANPSYFGSAEEWQEYRQVIRTTAARADAITTISQDVARAVASEHLPIDPRCVFPIPYGTDHVTGTEARSVPPAMTRNGWLARQFLLCLGTDYAHKNRDVARRLHSELQVGLPDLGLVMAGAQVPFGSSRLAEFPEMLQAQSGDGVLDLGDVTGAERNWLLSHCDLVVYPTSAEGFGLVPFEAARFGRPTLNVSFGPLSELVAQPPVRTVGWAIDELTASAQRLLGDPDAAKAQIESVLESGGRYTWARTAAQLSEVFRIVLSQPTKG
jgi:glycosyltransferase involved in cell wall biosynthesis